jgi:hypothetical protein
MASKTCWLNWCRHQQKIKKPHTQGNNFTKISPIWHENQNPSNAAVQLPMNNDTLLTFIQLCCSKPSPAYDLRFTKDAIYSKFYMGYSVTIGCIIHYCGAPVSRKDAAILDVAKCRTVIGALILQLARRSSVKAVETASSTSQRYLRTNE